MDGTPTTYDFVFAGFGLSGMALLDALLETGACNGKRVLIIDRDKKEKNDRTWSFWTDNTTDHYTHLATKAWNRTVFYSKDGERTVLPLSKYAYYTVESSAFYDYIKEKIKSSNAITWVQEEIEGVSREGVVSTKENHYTGHLVFNAYYDREKLRVPRKNILIWQHFYGLFVETTDSVFDEDQFLIMDYRDTEKERTNFFYVLPFSARYALVEFTEFSSESYAQETYREMVEHYIQRYFTKGTYVVKRVEMNAIPMTDYRMPVVESKKVIAIGSKAGFVKPSSGYGFTRTIDRSKKLAAMIAKQETLSAKEINSSPLFSLFDEVVLKLIASSKLHGEQLFSSLFRRLNTDFLFQFLDEKTAALDFVKMMFVVPKKTRFIRYFFRTVWNKWPGAKRRRTL